MNKLFGSRLTVGVLVAVCVIALLGVIAYAASTLNKTVPINLIITNPPVVSGNNTAADIYSDANCTIPLTAIPLTYYQGSTGTNSTVYVKASEITNVTIIPQTLPDGVAVASSLGDPVGIARPINIHVAGGVTGNYTIQATFQGN